MKVLLKFLLVKFPPLRYLYILYMELAFRFHINRQISKSSGKVKKILESVRDKGIYIEEGFWDANKVQDYVLSFERIFHNKEEGDFKSELNKYLGSNRYYHVERDVPQVENDFKENQLLKEIATKFNGVLPPNRKTMYQHSFFDPNVENFYSSDTSKSELTPIAPKYHFDFMRRTLKAIVYLNDINKENGATEFCLDLPFYMKIKMEISRLGKRSQYVKEYFSGITTQDASIWSHEEAKNLNLEKFAIPVEGKAGTLAIFDTYFLHRANPVLKNDRRILWYYFNF